MDKTLVEILVMSNIYGCIDKETEERHLKEFPLKEGWIRHYYDHTGRFFFDADPNASAHPLEQELSDTLKSEIDKEIINKILKDVGRD